MKDSVLIKFENVALIIYFKKLLSPVRWCPSRCWWAWLFRTTQTSCAAGHPWTANRGGCTADVGLVDPPCRLPATMTCGTRTGTVCCPPAQCLWAPNTFGLGPASGSTRAVWETSSCKPRRMSKPNNIANGTYILLKIWPPLPSHRLMSSLLVASPLRPKSQVLSPFITWNLINVI